MDERKNAKVCRRKVNVLSNRKGIYGIKLFGAQLRKGKYQCTADLMLDWFGFGQTSKSVLD